MNFSVLCGCVEHAACHDPVTPPTQPPPIHTHTHTDNYRVSHWKIQCSRNRKRLSRGAREEGRREVLFWNVTRNAFEMPNDRRCSAAHCAWLSHWARHRYRHRHRKGNIIIICGIVAILIKYVSHNNTAQQVITWFLFQFEVSLMFEFIFNPVRNLEVRNMTVYLNFIANIMLQYYAQVFTAHVWLPRDKTYTYIVCIW